MASSLRIRHLPGKQEHLIDKAKFPKNVALFNPSADGQYIYIRANTHTSIDETNSIIIHDAKTGKLNMIDAPMDMLRPNANLFKGIEDLRIVVHEGRIWFSATSTHASAHMMNDLLVGYFKEDLTGIEKMSVVDIGSLPVKNVCPFVWNNKLCLLDSFKRKIYSVSEDGENPGIFIATLEKVIRVGSGIDDTCFRGSTSPVHMYGNTWGFIVHESIINDTSISTSQTVMRLAYFHRWVEIDIERGVITFVSEPFFCIMWGIEYISGIRYSRDKNEIELFIGINDETSARFITTLEDLRVGK